MKQLKKRLVSVMLALAVALTLMAAAPQKASAMNAEEIADYIREFYHGGLGEFEVSVSEYYEIVTVIGLVTDAMYPMDLDIAAGCKVIWRASYTCLNSGADRYVIKLTGGGTFQIEGFIQYNTPNRYEPVNAIIADLDPGGAIIVTDGGNVEVTEADGPALRIPENRRDISITMERGWLRGNNSPGIYSEGDNIKIDFDGGGTNGIYATGDNVAISVVSGGTGAVYAEGRNASIRISGGYNWSQNDVTLYACGENASVNISGGTTASENETAVAANGQGASVTISGGDVYSGGGTAATVLGQGSSITVSGGEVSATESAALLADGQGASVTVSGGFVFAYGDAIEGENNVIAMSGGAPAISGAAVVCAWDKPNGTFSYERGSSTDLTVSPASASVTWDTRDYTTDNPLNPVITKTGVTYRSGVNSGFFVIEGLPITGDAPGGSISHFTLVNSYSAGIFTDVAASSWYVNAVAAAYEYGLMRGNSAVTFNPSGDITLAEAITVATRVHCKYMTGSDEFPPVTAGAPWYISNVDYAIANGIISATAFSNYSRAATRAEMAYIFSGALPAEEFPAINTVNSLPDVTAATPYSEAIFMLYRAGILTGGDSVGTFTPNGNISRAEAAAIISRVILPSERISGRTYG